MAAVDSTRRCWRRGLLSLGRAAPWLLAVACSGGSAPSTTLPPNSSGWWRDKVVYEVFVRSFADSNGDGVGDLPGLTARLPALGRCPGVAAGNSLGVDALWLMPIFPSPSYHGYDVTDYTGVNREYGTLADFDALVARAHECGVKIVLDMVLNHSSNSHPWFVDSAAAATSAKRSWYVWSDSNPYWNNPTNGTGSAWFYGGNAWYYAAFSPSMPDLNLTNPAVEAELVGAMKSWLRRGVDGFRLDAVPYFVESGQGQGQRNQPATHALLKRLRAALQAEYPQTLLVGEVWQAPSVIASYYGAGDELGLAFSFDLASSLVGAAAGGTGGVLVNGLAAAEDSLAGIDLGFQAPFLSNHDQLRVGRQVAGDAGAMRVTAAALFAMAGTPFVYYGEELGMQGEPGSDDRAKRTPYRWTSTAPGFGFTTGTPWYGSTTEAAGVDLETERLDPDSLWNLYRALIALRHAQSPLQGTALLRLTPVPTAASSPVVVLRGAPGKRILFLANFGIDPTGAFTVDLPQPAPAATNAPTLLLAEGLSVPPALSGVRLTFTDVQPRGFAFVSLD